MTPPHAGADRNLLFGILALQLDFVTRDQLVAAMHAWVLDKARPLGQVLVEQNALAAAKHALLDALVVEHLKQHDDDPHKSLAALSSLGSARDELSRIADPEVAASLGHVSADPFATRSLRPMPAGARFRILRPHAKGGLGEVYVAHDEELGREVALKEIQPQHAYNADSQARFMLEAEVTGGLEHPGVVPVYGLGHYNDGRPYYAMRFIRGDSLMTAIERFHKAGPSDAAERERQLRQLLRRFYDVCNAIEYAHSRGVLHRDLKPGNIMLGKYGETLVVDWGLAKPLGRRESPSSDTPVGEAPLVPSSGSGSAPTVMGSAIGTPAYMSPEQASGRLDLLGPASDVYSLGATLYCLLTGQPPIAAAAAGDALLRVQQGDFPRPRQVKPDVPPPLEAVCLKAMALRPADRYASVSELGKDIERSLDDAPVLAWPEPLWERVRRWRKRHRVLVWSAGWCLGVALFASVVTTVLLLDANERLRMQEGETSKANDALTKANEEATSANQTLVKANEEIKSRGAETKKANTELAAANTKEKSARDLAEMRLATSLMQLARSRFEDNDARLADATLDEVDVKFRRTPWKLLKNYVQGSLSTLHGHTEGVTGVAFAADGQVLASASHDQTVKLWDTRTGRELRTLHGHKDRVTGVAFAADGQMLASASQDGTVKLWDTRTGKELRPPLRGHTGHVLGVAFAADGQVLASANQDGTVKLWDTRTGRELRPPLRGHTDRVTGVAFAADGQVLASASWDQTVKLWDTRTGKEIRPPLRGHTGHVTGVAFAADGQVLASASQDKTVKLWDTRTGKEIHTLRGHTDGVRSVAFAADGQMLASVSSDRTVKLWDTRTGKELRTLHGHAEGVTGVAFAADGQMLASASWDRTVKVWDARNGQELRTLHGHTHRVLGVAFAADGQVLASVSSDETVTLWDTRTGKELRTLRGHAMGVLGVAFAADGEMLASASQDGTVKLWDTRTGKEIHTLHGHAEHVLGVAFAADGQVLAAACSDGTVKLWDTRTGEVRHTLRGHTGYVLGVAFAADGQVLAAACSDGTVKLWDTRTGEVRHTLRGHTNGVRGVAFAADGQVLASASQDRTAKLWDMRTGQELHTLHGHTDHVTGVAFAADGQVLASVSWDRTVKLWDARTGQELRTLRGHTDYVTGVAFAADGQVLASASEDRTVKLWDTRTCQERHSLRGHTEGVDGVAFAADGQVLASASQDRTAKLWDMRTGQELHTLHGHTDHVTGVAFAADGQVLASASQDKTVKLWDARTGKMLHTLCGHTEGVDHVLFAADGKQLWSRSRYGKVRVWNAMTGEQLVDEVPPAAVGWTGYRVAWAPDSSEFAVGLSDGRILLVPRDIASAERRFRLLANSPDLHLHRERAEAAEKDKQPQAFAFRLGRYLAGKQYYAAAPQEAVRVAGWLSTAPDRLNLLAGLPARVRTPLHPPTFPDGIACTGVLYHKSGIDPKRLLIGTGRALEGDPASWLNHALHGGALLRNGEHVQALAALQQAVKLHGKPHPLTHHLMALAHLASGDREKAQAVRSQAEPAKDAPWEDHALHRLLAAEVDALIAAKKD